tara:strand:- start:58653 stop:58838 length:186 start_codon:yes stop_codon:yes gene_type:complete
MHKNVKVKQKGSSLVEYAVAVIVITGLMFLPVKGGKSTVELLYDGFKDSYAGYVWGMSIPT